MARIIEFGRRAAGQLLQILTFYDERNGSDKYSRQLLSSFMENVRRIAETPTVGQPSDREDVRFFYLMGFTVIYRYNLRKVIVLSIRSSKRKPLKIYQKQ